MAKLSKRVRAFREKVDATRAYSLDEAIGLLKEFGTVKFNETVEVAVNLGVDARKSDQGVRGATTLPHGTGSVVRVAVFTQGENAEKAKAAGKPVIATMGNVAASGGYFVAMNADKVIAQPGTITGSIGVLAGKMLTDAFWKKLGVTWDYAHVGESAYFWSSGKDFTPEQWAQFNTWLDRVYVDFTQKAADGRGMSREDIHAVAKGRVWTGVDAKNRGLVDELGGFQMALNLTREALDLGADAPIELRVFPKEKTLVELVLENGVIRTLSNADVLVGVIKDLRPVFQAARAVGLTHQPGVVEMRNLRIE